MKLGVVLKGGFIAELVILLHLFSVLQTALLDQELLYWSIQAETSKKQINTR